MERLQKWAQTFRCENKLLYFGGTLLVYDYVRLLY